MTEKQLKMRRLGMEASYLAACALRGIRPDREVSDPETLYKFCKFHTADFFMRTPGAKDDPHILTATKQAAVHLAVMFFGFCSARRIPWDFCPYIP